jgi:hypothetical protein
MANQNPVTDDDAPAHFTGEEGGEERTTPAKNLAAAGVVALLGIVAMILSAQMSNPDTLATAPGLLPFLVGAGLVLMALGLAVKSVRAGALRGNQYRPDPGHWFANAENRRTLLLIGIVFAYILVVDAVWFEFDIPLGFFTLPVSSFETLSTLALTIILKCFWRGSLLRCVVISALFSLALANVFRFGFVILLPGAA